MKSIIEIIDYNPPCADTFEFSINDCILQSSPEEQGGEMEEGGEV